MKPPSQKKNQATDAAERLRNFEKPVLLIWGDKDRIFKPELAKRLAAMIPAARIEWIPGGKTFIALDDPNQVADRIIEFLPVDQAVASLA